MDIVIFFINAVLKPPSFNDYQAMNSIDMIVTTIAFLFREVSIGSLGIAALLLIYCIIYCIVKDVRSKLTLK